MRTFKDKDGKSWEIALDAPTIRAVRSECDGLDLADLEGKSFAKLVDDPCLLVDVLWVLCRKQASKDGITDEQFGHALVGDSIELATAAMLESIADFFPKEKRSLIQAVVNKDRAVRRLGIEKAIQKINDPNLEQRILESLEKQMESEIQSALTQFCSATTAQDS